MSWWLHPNEIGFDWTVNLREREVSTPQCWQQCGFTDQIWLSSRNSGQLHFLSHTLGTCDPRIPCPDDRWHISRVFPGFLLECLPWEADHIHLIGLKGGQGTVLYRRSLVDGAWLLDPGDRAEVGRNRLLSPHPFLLCCRIHWRMSILSFIWGLKTFHEGRWHRTHTGWCFC